MCNYYIYIRVLQWQVRPYQKLTPDVCGDLCILFLQRTLSFYGRLHGFVSFYSRGVLLVHRFMVWFMVFNATISVISWRSVLLVEETGEP